MPGFFRKITAGAALVTNFVFLFLFLFACITPYIPPGQWWFTGFMGLLFPYLLASVCIFFLFWLFVRPKFSLFSLTAMILGYTGIEALLPFNLPSVFPVSKSAGELRLMSWNIRRFTPFYSEKFNPADTLSQQDILKEISFYNPDVVCLQEFVTRKENGRMNMIEKIKKDLNYPYHVFSEDEQQGKKYYSGTAVFSRLPVVDFDVIPFPDRIARGTESIIRASLRYGQDTIEVYTMHLKSFGFGPRDYSNFSKIKNQQDTGLLASKNLFRKMSYTFAMHGLQADFVKNLVDASEKPKIICGDLNDVPNSYAYFTIRDKRRDAFLEKGSGIGKTFTSSTSQFLGKLPTLRIDYIFTDPFFKTSQFTRVIKRLSDHRALVADFALDKKQ